MATLEEVVRQQAELLKVQNEQIDTLKSKVMTFRKRSRWSRTARRQNS